MLAWRRWLAGGYESAARPPGAGPAPVTWPRVRAGRSLARHRRPARPWLYRAPPAAPPGLGAGVWRWQWPGTFPRPWQTRLRCAGGRVEWVEQEQPRFMTPATRPDSGARQRPDRP